MQVTTFCRKRFFRLSIIGLALLLSSCGGKKETKPPVPDVSEIKLRLNVRRFDKELLALKQERISWDGLQKLQKSYPDFFPAYFESVVNLTQVKDSSAIPFIKDFLFDVDVSAIYEDTEKKYADLGPAEAQLTDAFRLYAHYFPEKKIPEIIAYVFGFNYAVVAMDSSLAVGLDQYLGEDYRFYSHLPDYLRYRKQEAFMVPDMLRGWATTEFEDTLPRTDLLDEMIFQGKILYLLDRLLPEAHDTIKMGYTSGQLDFCEKNEYQVWSYFVENRLLYSKDPNAINKYCGEAPFSAGMPKESPGRTGAWIGWQIVKSYMMKNPKMKFQQMMEEHDYKKILNLSKYKPKR